MSETYTKPIPDVFALVMMVKNERDHILKSLNSVEKFINTIILFDTGSEDDTLGQAREWCETRGKKLYSKTGTFTNFQDSRNECLAFADSLDIPEIYYLLLDASDEIQGNYLDLFNITYHQKDDYALCFQKWMFSNGHTPVYFTYWNIRVVRARSGWRFKGVVHEFIHNPTKTADQIAHSRLTDGFVIFQDRTADGGKTHSRLERDYVLLKEAVEKEPNDPRTLFYFARTCESLNKADEAITHYQLRASLEDGFGEEIFWAHYGMGKLWFAKNQVLRGIEQMLLAVNRCERPEPLIFLAEYFQSKGQFYLAYLFTKQACQIPFNDKFVLFVDRTMYEYTRWHILGIVSYYCGKYKDGFLGCTEALKHNPESEIDKNNQKFYLEKAVKEPEKNGRTKVTFTNEIYLKNHP